MMHLLTLYLFGASTASAFHNLILPRDTEGVFASQPSGTGTGVSQQAYDVSPTAASTGNLGPTSTFSGGGASISSGILPLQNSINGTYYYTVGLSRTASDIAQQPEPTLAGSIISVTQDTQPISIKPTSPTSERAGSDQATTYSPIASPSTPPPVSMQPSVALHRDTSDPKNVVPASTIGLDYGEIGKTGMQSSKTFPPYTC